MTPNLHTCDRIFFLLRSKQSPEIASSILLQQAAATAGGARKRKMLELHGELVVVPLLCSPNNRQTSLPKGE
jgi:hypothetical protein